jgi:hypothetical protein
VSVISISNSKDVATFNANEDLKALGVWECISTTFTAVFPPGLEPPAHLVAECRQYDPKFVPVLCRKVFRTPANTEEEFSHYVICREVPTLEVKGDWDAKPPIRLEAWPQNFGFDPKAIYELKSWTIPWPKGSPMIGLGLPDIDKPFDQKLVDYVRFEAYAYANWTKDEWNLWLSKAEEDDRKTMQKLTEDLAYQIKQDFGLVNPDEGLGLQEVTPKPFVETAKKELQ